MCTSVWLLTPNTVHEGRGIEALHLWELRIVKRHAAARERRCNCYEDMDNLVYDISFFLFIFFLWIHVHRRFFFSESLQRNLFVVHQKGGKEGQGWRSGESTRLTPMWPGLKSRRRRHMWVEFVVGSLPCSERFFSRYSGFPLSSKTNTCKFQFESGTHRHVQKRVHMNSYVLRG